MSFAAAVTRDLTTGSAGRVVSPEFSRIELGGVRRPVLSFADPHPIDADTAREVSRVVRAAAVLDLALDAGADRDVERSSRRRFLDPPRGSRAERAAAELYRRIRLPAKIALRPGVRAERRDALVYLGVDVDKEIYEIEITSAGLDPLELGALKLLEFARTPYPGGWVEAFLVALIADLTAETQAFHDEDNTLLQFRAPFPFNRHRRFDRGNPRFRFVDDALEIEIPEAFKNAAVFAIDFHVIVDDLPHIIPVEAPTDGRPPPGGDPETARADSRRANASGGVPPAFHPDLAFRSAVQAALIPTRTAPKRSTMDVPHLRVAVTTDSLVKCDANFVAAKQMVFYDVSADDSEFVDVVHFSRGGKKGPGGGLGMANGGRCVMEDMGDDDGTGFDPIVERVEALRDCSILMTSGISDLAAVRVQDASVFPVKSEREREIDEVIDAVQIMLRGNPPLWVRRVMRDGGGRRMALDDQEI